MRFAHISDLHLADAPQDHPLLRNNLYDALEILFGDLREIQTNLDFVAVTGDLAENGDIGSYLKIKQFMDMLDIPVFVVPGNHDLREPFRSVFGSSGPLPEAGPLDFYVNSAEAQIIGLDSLIEGTMTGRLTDRQLDRLQTNLLSATAPHTIILLHHSPFSTGLAEFDEITTIEGDQVFGELIRNARSKVTLLCGHIHRPYHAVWMGAQCYVAGSPAFQFGGESPFGDCELGLVDEPFAYFIHSLRPAGDHVVSTRYVELDSTGGESALRRDRLS
uniref:metallophosphoesterase n=1 Tax=Pararhizobium sp. IMCC3301 TaxID=3067904 RepID=UPI0027409763|nr:metallophosphoesterase [Pararhizobium sp. IMCC3301]